MVYVGKIKNAKINYFQQIKIVLFVRGAQVVLKHVYKII